MIAADWIALLPLIVLSGGVALLLLVVSFWRHHALAAGLTVVAFGATLAAIPIALPVLPRQVTPLFWFDRYGAFFYALFATAGLVTALLSYRYLQRRHGDLEEYYILLATATIGAMAMASAAHFASFLLGLEILSISLYVLVGYPEEHHAPLEAALKYLLLSGVGSTTLLFGMALIYLDTGTLEFATLADVLRGGDAASLYLIVGNALLLAGIAFKLSLVPFHMWTPDVYEGAPAPVTGYLATVSKGAVFALALRYVADSGALENAPLFFAVSAVAVLSMVVGNLLALLQQNVKRILAYSSIAHLGYLLIALLVVSSTARSRTRRRNRARVSRGVFRDDARRIRRRDRRVRRGGRSRRRFDRRLRGSVLAAATGSPRASRSVLLSLAGIPMTLGFIAKFYLFAPASTARCWVLLWALIVGSGIGLFYYLRIIFAMTRQHDESVGDDRTAGSLADRSAIVALTLVLIVFGVYPMPLIEFARTAMASFGAATAAARVATDMLGGGL